MDMMPCDNAGTTYAVVASAGTDGIGSVVVVLEGMDSPFGSVMFIFDSWEVVLSGEWCMKWEELPVSRM